MGNAFMPSVASSLNQAGQGSLLEVLQQRVLQAEMQKQLFAQQRQAGMDQFNVAMRMQGNERDEERLRISRENADRDKTAAEARAKKDAEEARGRLNTSNAANMFFEGLARNPEDRSPGMLNTAFNGKVPVSMLPEKPVKKPTLDEKVAEATALTEARERAKSKFKTAKGPKPPKDTPGAPSGFRTAITNRRGTKGFNNLKEAEASITGRWQDWRKNYPGLSLNAVRASLQDIYGERASGGGTDAIAQAVIAAINADKDEE